MEMVPIFLSGLSDWFLAKRFVQHIIYFIHAQFFLEAADSRIFIDMYHLHNLPSILLSSRMRSKSGEFHRPESMRLRLLRG